MSSELQQALTKIERLSFRAEVRLDVYARNKAEAEKEIDEALAAVGTEHLGNRELRLVMALKRVKAVLNNG